MGRLSLILALMLGPSCASTAARPDVRLELRLAVTWLLTQQGSDGAWRDPSGKPSKPFTALVVSVLASPKNPERGLCRSAIEKGAAYLIRENASGEKLFSGYEGPLTMLALHRVDPKAYRDRIDEIRQRVLAAQIRSAGDWKDGGWAYNDANPTLPPDISVASVTLDALDEVGFQDVDALRRAAAFVRRCQNFDAGDGGFTHSPFSGKAGMDAGRWRSYGSATCDGIRSLFRCRVDPRDPSFASAVQWLEREGSVDENPGAGRMCYFYYLWTLSKTHRVARMSRADEIIGRLLDCQGSDGSWRNPVTLMWEGHASMATCLAIDAIFECLSQR